MQISPAPGSFSNQLWSLVSSSGEKETPGNPLGTGSEAGRGEKGEKAGV